MHRELGKNMMGKKVTNGYSKSKRIQDKRQSVKGQETWIVKGDDCEN